MFNIDELTEDEYEAALKVIKRLRAEKAELAKEEEAKSILIASTNKAISLVGIARAKSLIREINNNLRAIEEETFH